MNTVSFPGLGLTLHLNRVAFSIGSFHIYWYGIIIALGFFLGAVFCVKHGKYVGIKGDDFLDALLWGGPLGIVGARIYYIVFNPSLYFTDGKLDLKACLNIHQGGLAIYGGIIVGTLTAFLVARYKKISFAALIDLTAYGLLIGQAVGRWGNFVNGEAHGGPTSLPWRMGLETAQGYMEVHPTFLYESLWNLLGLVLLTLFITFVGEHMDAWTGHFSIGLPGAAKIALILFAAFFLIVVLLNLISYQALRLQYHFTPMPEGPLLDKIRKLQEGSKKKVKAVYIYDESRKSTSKNAFLLKLFWHREFGIADNFINENEERELLAVLSHEIGHLKHRKNWRNYLSYLSIVLLFLVIIGLIAWPSPVLRFVDWVNLSFGISVTNYTMILNVLSALLGPVSILFGLFNNSRSRAEEYEADREAVSNGYGQELIATFKRLSNDELVDVNPHPLIETLEYDHPGMANRIAAIQREMARRRQMAG